MQLTGRNNEEIHGFPPQATPSSWLFKALLSDKYLLNLGPDPNWIWFSLGFEELGLYHMYTV